MEKLDLFYEIRNLHNISSKAKESYAQIMSRINLNREYEFGVRNLLIYPTKEQAHREYMKVLTKTNYFRIDENSVSEATRDVFYTFIDLDTILFSNFLTGRRFTYIRFLG